MVSPADTRSSNDEVATAAPPTRRRGRRLLAWSAAAVVAAIIAAVAWRSSDIVNTSVLVAPRAAAIPATDLPGSSVAAGWSAPSRPQAADPVQADTVVVGGAHGVVGRDPATGAERWHYLRSTATLCDWTAQDSTVIAIFRSGGGCDEAIALQAGTGARLWYRSVSFRPDATLSSTAQIVVAETPTGLAALGTTSSGTRWGYRPPADCQIAQTMPGDVGVAVALDCGAAAARLVLLDGFNGSTKWSADLDDRQSRLLTADGVVAVSAPGAGIVSVYGRDGTLQATIPAAALAPAGDTGGAPTAIGAIWADGLLLVTTGRNVIAIDPVTAIPVWSRAGSSVGPDPDETAVLVLDAGTDTVTRVGATDGTLRGSTALGGAAAEDARPLRVGSTVVLVSADGVATYR